MASKPTQKIEYSEETIAAYRRNFQARLDRRKRQQEVRRAQVLEKICANASAIIADYASVERAWLFGSLIHPGAFHPESDVDIAVEGATAQAYFALWKALEHAFPDLSIDLRDISTTSPFTDLVRQTGLLIYERENSPAAN